MHSSEITWRAQIVTQSNIALFTKAKFNTFGWDEISIYFKVKDHGKSAIHKMDDKNNASIDVVRESTMLTFEYSWIVKNPLISFVEKTFVRESMINDNVKAINNLGEICESLCL